FAYCGRLPQLRSAGHLGSATSKILSMPDKPYAVDRVRRVPAVIRTRAGRRGYQPAPLIVAQRLDVDLCRLGEFAAIQNVHHCTSYPQAQTLYLRTEPSVRLSELR